MITFGIDAGGTYLKFGTPDDSHSLPLPYTKDLIFNLINQSISTLLLTGAGAKTIASWLKQANGTVNDITAKPKIFNEFMATGFGGAFLAKLNECIVVNIGSGTPILYVKTDEQIVNHIGGTGLGSASLVGLSHFILEIDDLTKISDLAMKGDPTRVNLMVGDLYDRATEDLGLPGDLTASNFGKYQDWRVVKNNPNKNDILAGLHVMVGETIAGLANQASRAYRSDLPVVITGGGTLNEALVKTLKKTFQYLHKEVIIPSNAIYGTLQGLFVLHSLEKESS